MLTELRVRDLGVIADLHLELGAGMTALTGETGAGKTLVVEALELLVGGRADASMVRLRCEEALVEGRFVGPGGEEVVLARSVPASGRSRAWINGRMATAAELADVGRSLVDLHGQHAHQSLLHQGAQRAALDRYAGADLSEVEAFRAARRALVGELSALGGDARQRAREVDLLAFQLGEIEAARIGGPDEAELLAAEEETLAGASELRRAVELAHDLLSGSGSATAPGPGPAAGAVDLVGRAASLLGRHGRLADAGERLRALGAELADSASELRTLAEHLEEDPARLAEVQERRHLLAGLMRKYGDSLAEVITFAGDLHRRLADLEGSEARRQTLEHDLAGLDGELEDAERRVGDLRRKAAAPLAAEIEAHLAGLALPGARIEVAIGEGDIGDDVELRLGANPGEPVLPLAKVASGGELARAMLAVRLVLDAAPPTLVFDEVDAGIGGEAALAVGSALARLASARSDRQVLVVTHLAQVAAFADCQIAVRKSVTGDRTIATAARVDGDERVAELSRMLSGHAGSGTGRAHAADLLKLRSAGSAQPATSVEGKPPRRKP